MTVTPDHQVPYEGEGRGYAFNLAPFFVRVEELEFAGKTLAWYIRKLHQDGFDMDLCPGEVKRAMRKFDGDSTDAPA